jgi:hypothetical protein
MRAVLWGLWWGPAWALSPLLRAVLSTASKETHQGGVRSFDVAQPDKAQTNQARSPGRKRLSKIAGARPTSRAVMERDEREGPRR